MNLAADSPSLSHTIPLATLQSVLDRKYGVKGWQKLEPETILMDFDFPDYLVMEKIYVLKAINANLNHVLSMPEFLLWATNVCNNEFAEFEMIDIPTSLELAYLVFQMKKIGGIIGQPFLPTEELIDTLAYLLRMDGYGEAVAPFEFIPNDKINPEAFPVDAKLSALKAQANAAYIAKMEEHNA
jgi:hypothetical protein